MASEDAVMGALEQVTAARERGDDEQVEAALGSLMEAMRLLEWGQVEYELRHRANRLRHQAEHPECYEPSYDLEERKERRGAAVELERQADEIREAIDGW